MGNVTLAFNLGIGHQRTDLLDGGQPVLGFRQPMSTQLHQGVDTADPVRGG